MRKNRLEENSSMAATAETIDDSTNNVLTFSSTLQELRRNVDPNLVRQRKGGRDRNGNVKMVEYVEWHSVADILDQTAPNWAHTVKDIRKIGGIIAVTVAITIDGVTREGIGTGPADTEIGIKKAEHDALKRAAVKFGIARDLYKKEYDAISGVGQVDRVEAVDPVQDPIAKTLGDLVTAKQLGMIRAISRELGVDPDKECKTFLKCRTDELSKRAASVFIRHLQDFERHAEAAQAPMRRAG